MLLLLFFVFLSYNGSQWGPKQHTPLHYSDVHCMKKKDVVKMLTGFELHKGEWIIEFSFLGEYAIK